MMRAMFTVNFTTNNWSPELNIMGGCTCRLKCRDRVTSVECTTWWEERHKPHLLPNDSGGSKLHNITHRSPGLLALPTEIASKTGQMCPVSTGYRSY